MTTIVIAAHNESAVIGTTLDALLADARPGEFDIIVSANGCTDDTAAVARAHPGVRVIESPVPGKAAALNRADHLVISFPVIYLDADIPASTATIRALTAALEGPGAALVATPSRVLEMSGRPVPVRAYYSIQRRLPVFDEGLFGRGLIALSDRGRGRFATFPEVVADDLFLDSLFTPEERIRVHTVHTTVATPMHTGDLIRRLVRVRRGNAALRAVRPPIGAVRVRSADRLSWLRDVVLPRPWLAPAATIYVAITCVAAALARRGEVGDITWGRDESTRTIAPAHR